MRGRSQPFAAVPPTVTSRPDDAALSELETANRHDLDSTALCGRIADPSADFPQPTARETACGLPEPAQCRAIRYPLAGAIRWRRRGSGYDPPARATGHRSYAAEWICRHRWRR